MSETIPFIIRLGGMAGTSAADRRAIQHFNAAVRERRPVHVVERELIKDGQAWRSGDIVSERIGTMLTELRERNPIMMQPIVRTARDRINARNVQQVHHHA